MPAVPPALRVTSIVKRFGSQVVNDGISLTLGRGEVLALLGENGAGKSTLVNILFGHYVAESGTVEVFGRRLPPGDPKAALAAGIGMVHQHFTLADNMSVLDNILIGSEPLWQPFSRREAARRRVLAVAKRVGFELRPDARVAELSVGERQRVEIVKALVRGARVLVLDEPTAVLTPQESEALFASLAKLVSQGLAVIFISHKLDEVLRISHRVAVLRAGRLVAERAASETSKAELATLMVGRKIEMPTRHAKQARRAKRPPPGDAVLSMRGVSVHGVGRAALHGIDLEVRAGEIVAIAGISGNGQVTLAELLAGTRKADAGRLQLRGCALAAKPREWVDAAVARVPEGRHAEGVIGDLPVWENAVSERLHSPAFSSFGFVRRADARAQAQRLVERFDVRLQSIDVPARALSGGNMQKLVLGRALSVGGDRPALIVASQPTWGLDIGAVAFVHRCLLEAAAADAAVLLICEDLDEIFALADRVAVMHQGRLGAARPVSAWTLEAIGLAMAGADEEATADAA